LPTDLSARSVRVGLGSESPRAAILSTTSGDSRSSLRTCDTRARETHTLRAKSAAEEHSPLSKAACHSRAHLLYICSMAQAD